MSKNLSNSIELSLQNRKKFFFLTAFLLFLLFVLLLYFAAQGAMALSFSACMRIVLAKLSGGDLSNLPANTVAVVWNIRLPRLLCALGVGAGLSLSGAVFQSLLANPLADPFTLGVSTGASFGASLAILLNLSYGLLLPPALFAIPCAFLSLLLVILMSRRSASFASNHLIISGIIVSSILSAGISLMKMLAGEHVGAIVFWIMGSLAGRSWGEFKILWPVVLPASFVCLFFARDLNLMSLGDREAEMLGVNPKRTRLLYLILASCITGACVAVSGVISFVGLVVPHLLRMWLSADNRFLLPLSTLLGALLLLVADNASRLIFSSEIPVGVLTTLLGGPFFLYVFLRKPGGQKLC